MRLPVPLRKTGSDAQTKAIYLHEMRSGVNNSTHNQAHLGFRQKLNLGMARPAADADLAKKRGRRAVAALE